MVQKLKLEELNRIDVETFKQAEKIPLVIILDNIRSMHNVGAAFRTADAFLIEKIILCGITPQPPHREIHKAALGATESVDWAHEEETNNAIADLKSKGYEIIGLLQIPTLQFRHIHLHSENAWYQAVEFPGIHQYLAELHH